MDIGSVITGSLIFWSVFSTFVLYVAYKAFQVVPESNLRIIERFGKYHKTLRPGIGFIIPFLDKVKFAEITTYDKDPGNPDGSRTRMRYLALDGNIPTLEIIMDPPEIDAISSGIIQPVNADGPDKSPYTFKEEMRNKLLGGKDSVKYNCPGSTIKDFSYQNSCNNAGYDLGTWAIAYLDNKAGENSLIDTFYPNLDDLGWEGAFNLTYGVSSEDFYNEFELPISEQMKILPDK